MKQGTFNVSRSIWDDPQFPPEPFTKREAWLWLVSEASWKPRTYRLGSHSVDLERGQLAASTRGLADKWQWKEPKVRRYLKMLKECQNINSDTDAGVTRITICNYEVYQNRKQDSDAPTDAPATQDRRTSDAIQNKEKIINTPAARADAPATGPAAHVELGFKVLEAMGINPKDPTYLGNTGIVAQWLENGWNPDLDILATVKAVTERRAGRGDRPPRNLSYFTNAISEAYNRRISAGNVVAMPQKQKTGLPVTMPANDWKFLSKHHPDADERVTVGEVSVVRWAALRKLKNYYLARREIGARASFSGFPTGRLNETPESRYSLWPDDLIKEAKAAAETEFQHREAQA